MDDVIKQFCFDSYIHHNFAARRVQYRDIPYIFSQWKWAY